MTKHFERQIERLKERILTLGGMVEKAVDEAIRAIESRNVDLARKAVELLAEHARARFAL